MNDGKADEAKALTTEIVAVSQAEPGATAMTGSSTMTARRSIFFERFRDSDAAPAHLDGIVAKLR